MQAQKTSLLPSIDSLLCACLVSLSLSVSPSYFLARVFVLVGNQKDQIVSSLSSFRRKRRRKGNCVILHSFVTRLVSA